MLNFFQVPTLTRGRVWTAIGVALAADAIQIALGPLGWTFLDEVIDVATMITVTALLGFHPLLLPTLIIEFVPIVDMLPTWTGCVLAVVALRKGAPSPNPAAPAGKPRTPPPPIIDV